MRAEGIVKGEAGGHKHSLRAIYVYRESSEALPRPGTRVSFDRADSTAIKTFLEIVAANHVSASY